MDRQPERKLQHQSLSKDQWVLVESLLHPIRLSKTCMAPRNSRSPVSYSAGHVDYHQRHASTRWFQSERLSRDSEP